MNKFFDCDGNNARGLLNSSLLNQELLKKQKEWLEQCNADELAKRYPISRPFCFAVTKEYIQSQCRIMIVGQEAAGFDFYSSNWPIEDIQQFNVDYTSRQLGHENSYDYNASPFWNLFRKLKVRGVEPAWNNVDKFHRIEGNDKKTVPLTIEIEELVDTPYGNDNKSLLKREIELAYPNAVLFAIGPDYYKALAFSIGIDEGIIYECRPNIDQPCKEISDVVNLGIPVLWSYHPAYLNRINELDKVAEMAVAVTVCE